jgi:hypothetical protein
MKKSDVVRFFFNFKRITLIISKLKMDLWNNYFEIK